MENNIYNVDYFIEKFEAIPENLWFVGDYSNADGQLCALGHCGGGKGSVTAEADALFNLFRSNTPYWVHDINDGRMSEYPQPTPKQRILAALYDIKKLKTKKLNSEQKVQARNHSCSYTPPELKSELIGGVVAGDGLDANYID